MPVSSRLLLLGAVLLAACGDSPESAAPSPVAGTLSVQVSGLPSGARPAVSVTGPGGFARALDSATATLRGLPAGDYVVAAQEVRASDTAFAAEQAEQQVTVTPEQPARVSIVYSRKVGRLAVLVNGLPAGAAGDVLVTGPNGFSQVVTASDTLDGLAAGTYGVAARNVTSGTTSYAGAPAAQSVTVSRNQLTSHTVTYAVATTPPPAPTTGALRVTVNGLPSGTNAAVTVTGPNAYSRALTATTLLGSLVPGTYTIAATNVSTAGGTYTAPASQTAAVTAGSEAGATVAYTAPAPTPPPVASLNLRIDALYLVQSVQSLPDTVPLVANRDAYLRVFVTASATNTVTPAVRVRLYAAGATSPSAEYTLAAGRAFTPTGVRQDTLAASWNQLVPASLVQPGLRIQAEVDPANAVAETDETDNTYPSAGATRTLDVRTVNAFNVRFVPITTSANGRTGNVSSANVAQFLTTFRKIYAVQAVTADVRAPYVTTTTLPLQSNNGNNAWGTVLSELNAVRAAEGTALYYYGVVPTDYSSGVAGMGYVPGRTAIGWDRLPSGDGIFAHELGHNLSLNHAPCGGVSGADPSFPYTGGTIGVYGFDVAALALKLPTASDLMGYCSNNWISDYNYMKAFRYRSANASALVLGGAAPQPALLVWGRIVDGEVVLEPAFDLVAAPVLPPAPGPYAIEGLDAAGRRLFSYAFDAAPVSDVGHDERHFAFVLPMTGRGSLARLQVRGGSAPARQGGAAEPEQASAMRVGRGARLVWNARAYPMALVRDAATGQVLSFARGGEVTVPQASGALDVSFSDGVRSRAARVPVP